MRSGRMLALTFAAGVASIGAAAQESSTAGTARAELKTDNGNSAGAVRLVSTPNGVLLTADLRGLPLGAHGFHIHQTGKCDAPDFASAGGHFNPTGGVHGLKQAKGPHAGDLANAQVPSSGSVLFEVLVDDVTLKGGPAALLDHDGAAIIVHAEPDDYWTEPGGKAGARVACGVIQQSDSQE